MKKTVLKLLLFSLVCTFTAVSHATDTPPVVDQLAATPPTASSPAAEPVKQLPGKPADIPVSPMTVSPAAATPAPATEDKPAEPSGQATVPPATTPSAAKPAEPVNSDKAAQPATPVPPPQIMAQTPVLIGVVDPIMITTMSEPGKAGQSRMAEKKKKLEAQIDGKKKQLDKFKTDVEASLPNLSPEQREAKSKEFRKKVEDLQKFAQKAEGEMQQLQQELTKSLLEKVEKASEEYAKSHNLALVVGKRDLLYKSGMVVPMDITSEVVKVIDEQEKKGGKEQPAKQKTKKDKKKK